MTETAINLPHTVIEELTRLVRFQNDLIEQLIAERTVAGVESVEEPGEVPRSPESPSRHEAAETPTEPIEPARPEPSAARKPAPAAPEITLLPHEVRQAERALHLRERSRI